MTIYKSRIARLLQGRLNPYDYVTLPFVTLTALPYGEKGIWEEMEMSIHRRQYAECFWASLLPSLLLGWLLWWVMSTARTIWAHRYGALWYGACSALP